MSKQPKGVMEVVFSVFVFFSLPQRVLFLFFSVHPAPSNNLIGEEIGYSFIYKAAQIYRRSTNTKFPLPSIHLGHYGILTKEKKD